SVKQRGHVQCGVTTGFAGFSMPDDKGVWRGLDIDLCRAIAAAVLGDAEKYKAVPLNSQQRFTALQSGEIDVLTRNTSITQQRETALGAISAGVNFYDGRGCLVPKSLAVSCARDLDRASIGMATGTPTETSMADSARPNGITSRPVVIEPFNGVVHAFAAGRCAAFTSDTSGLASIRVSRM